MRLFEHPDFEQAILNAAEHFREQKLRAAIIEKDYYVTETLRVPSLIHSSAVPAPPRSRPRTRHGAVRGSSSAPSFRTRLREIVVGWLNERGLAVRQGGNVA